MSRNISVTHMSLLQNVFIVRKIYLCKGCEDALEVIWMWDVTVKPSDNTLKLFKRLIFRPMFYTWYCMEHSISTCKVLKDQIIKYINIKHLIIFYVLRILYQMCHINADIRYRFWWRGIYCFSKWVVHSAVLTYLQYD